jgi:hypothetical protein
MLRENWDKIGVILIILGLWLALPGEQARAVPSFARQTGLDCAACHTMFPELTPVGRNFKLNGFTATKHGDKPYEWPPPVAGMVQLSFTHLAKDMPGGSYDPTNRANDNVNVPQTISLFYGGRIYGEHLGALAQGTYDGVGNKFFFDNTDVRLTVKPELFGKPLILGLTVNNNPTVSDVLNTTPAWGFPAAAPVSGSTALTPTASAIITGLGGTVAGVGGYFYWNNLFYGEIAAYRTTRQGPTQFLGAGVDTNPTDGAAFVQDVTPYWRVFLNKQWGKHSVQVGHFGLVTRLLSPKSYAIDVNGNLIPNLVDTQGPVDVFTDLGFDAQYQFIGKKHIVTAQTSYIHEAQHLNDTFSMRGGAGVFQDRIWLDTYKINANYYYRTDDWGTVGGTVAYVNLWGQGDPILYGPAAGTGSRVHKPNSDYWIFEMDYVPWWKKFVTKFTLQYTAYSHFNGARSNYDGEAVDTFPYPQRKASQNNSLYLLVWQTF